MSDRSDRDGLNDSSLARRAIAGEVDAFETLLRCHFRVAFATALAIVGNRLDAEDACQDAFVSAFENLSACREPERFAAWLLQIVRNRARNARERRRVRQTASLDEIAPVIDTSFAASHDPAVRADIQSGLRQAFLHLSDMQATIVMLHNLEGLKHREIANSLGISVVMSRRHLSDALRILRAHLSDHDPTVSRDA